MSNDTPDTRGPGGESRRQRSHGGKGRNRNRQGNEQSYNPNRSHHQEDSNRSDPIDRGERKPRPPRRDAKPVPLTWWQKVLKAIGLYKEPVRTPRPEKQESVCFGEGPPREVKSNTRNTRQGGGSDATQREPKKRGERRERTGPPSPQKQFLSKMKTDELRLEDLHEFLIRRASNPIEKLTPIEISVWIDHGRLNHWLGATQFIFNICHLLNVRPRLYRGREPAFGACLNKLLEDGLAAIHSANNIVYRSSGAGFFGATGFHETFKSWIHKHQLIPPKTARKQFADELAPLFSYFSAEDNRQKLVTKIKSCSGITDSFNDWETLHLRRGDLAVLFAKDFENTLLREHFRDEVFCYNSGIKRWAFISQASLTHKKDQIGHAALRLHKQKDFKSDYSTILNQCQLQNRILFVFSDGYTKASRSFKSITSCPVSSNEIETIMTDTLIPLPHQPKSIRTAGENGASLLFSFDELLHISVLAKKVTCEESGFPKSFVNLFNIYQDSQANSLA